jgi:hypothetical protein
MGNGAIGIFILLILGQRLIGLIVLIVALYLKVSTLRITPSDRHTHYIWGSICLFALAVTFDDFALFSHRLSSQLSWGIAYLNIGCLCAALVLALLGKGPAKALLAVASLSILIIQSTELLHISLR